MSVPCDCIPSSSSRDSGPPHGPALDSKVARAHLLLATIQIDSNHRAQANDEIQKYLDQDPNGAFSDEAKALLKR